VSTTPPPPRPPPHPQKKKKKKKKKKTSNYQETKSNRKERERVLRAVKVTHENDLRDLPPARVDSVKSRPEVKTIPALSESKTSPIELENI
jgi:hypothetical protein